MTLTVDDYAVEIRDAARNRIGVLSESDLTGLTVTRQAWDVGSWTLSLPIGSAACDLLAQDGAGIIVTGPDWTMSGPVTSSQRVNDPSDDLGDHVEYAGASDAVLLGLPMLPDPTKTISAQSESAAWTGKRETLMLRALSTLHIWHPEVTVQADQSRGSDATLTADWQTILEALQTLHNRELRFGVSQQEDGSLLAWATPVSDLSSTIGFTTDTGALKQLTVTRSRPACTRCIVKATTGDTVSYQEVAPSAGTALESTWGVIPTLITIDEDTVPASAAAQAVSSAITDMTSASGTVADDAILDGVQPGDVVGVQVGEDEWITTPVSSITTGFTDGVIQTATLGDASTVQARRASDMQAAAALADLKRSLDSRLIRRRVARLERLR